MLKKIILIFLILLITITLYYYKFENFQVSSVRVLRDGYYLMTFGIKKIKINMHVITNNYVYLMFDHYLGVAIIKDKRDVYIEWTNIPQDMREINNKVGFLNLNDNNGDNIFIIDNITFKKIPYNIFFEVEIITFINQNNIKDTLTITTKNVNNCFTVEGDIQGTRYKGFGCISDTSENSTNNSSQRNIYFHFLKEEKDTLGNKNVITPTSFIPQRGIIYKENNIFKLETDKLGNWNQYVERIIKKKVSDKTINIKHDYNKIDSCLSRNPTLNTNNDLIFTSYTLNKRYNCSYKSRPISDKSNIKYFPVENNSIINKIVGNRNAVGFLIKKSELDKIKDDLVSPNFIDIYSENNKYPMCTLLPCNNSGDTCAITSDDFKDVPFLKKISHDYIYLIKAINDVCNINSLNNNYEVQYAANGKNCNEQCNSNQSKCVESRVIETGDKMSCNNISYNNRNMHCKCLKRNNIKTSEIVNISDINKIPTRNNTCRRVCLKQGKFCANLVETENNHTRFRNCHTVPKINTTSKCICEESNFNIKSIDLVRTDINAKVDEPKDIHYINLNDYKVKADIFKGYKNICPQSNTTGYLNIPKDNVSIIRNDNSTRNYCDRDCSLNNDCDAFTFNKNDNTCKQYKYNLNADTETYYKCGKKFYNSVLGKIADSNTTELIVEQECIADNNPDKEWDNSYEIAGVNSNTWGNLNQSNFYKDAKWIWSTSNAETTADILSEITFKYNYCSYKPHTMAKMNVVVDNIAQIYINDSQNPIEIVSDSNTNTKNLIKHTKIIQLNKGLNNIKIIAKNTGKLNSPAGVIMSVFGDDSEYLFSTKKDWVFKEKLLCDTNNTVGIPAVVIANKDNGLGDKKIGVELFDEKAKWIWEDKNANTLNPGTTIGKFIHFKYEFCSKSDLNDVKIISSIDSFGAIYVNGAYIIEQSIIRKMKKNDSILGTVWINGWGNECQDLDNLHLCNITYGNCNIKKGLNTIIVVVVNTNKHAGLIISAFDLNKNNIFNTNKDWRIVESYPLMPNNYRYLGRYGIPGIPLEDNNRTDARSDENGNVEALEHHNVDCGNSDWINGGINSFDLSRVGPPYDKIRYSSQCLGSPYLKNKRFNTEKKYTEKTPTVGGDTLFLSKHPMHCNKGVINQFKLNTYPGTPGKKINYEYTCKNIPTKNCTIHHHTRYDDGIQGTRTGGGNNVYLDRQKPKCPGRNKMMKSIWLEQLGNKRVGNTYLPYQRYRFQCCQMAGDLDTIDDGKDDMFTMCKYEYNKNHITNGWANAVELTGPTGSPWGKLRLEKVGSPVKVWQHSFRGWSLNLDIGKHNLTKGYNDNVSSIEVSPGYKAYVYQHSDNGGKMVEFVEGKYNLNDMRNKGYINDSASSIEVTSDDTNYSTSNNTNNKSSSFSPNARWIWYHSNAHRSSPPNENIYFMYDYCSEYPHNNASINIIIDNYGWFTINGDNKIQANGGWGNNSGGHIHKINIKKGLNTIIVKALNAGSGNNPAGIIATVRGNNNQVLFSTSKDWLVKNFKKE